jgi:hypothetical protein
MLRCGRIVARAVTTGGDARGSHGKRGRWAFRPVTTKSGSSSAPILVDGISRSLR